jgi:hypothetical protein
MTWDTRAAEGSVGGLNTRLRGFSVLGDLRRRGERRELSLENDPSSLVRIGEQKARGKKEKSNMLIRET